MVDKDFQQDFPSHPHRGGGEGSLRGGWGINDPPVLPPKNLSSPRLLLIGTVHCDPRGYIRALQALRRFQPDLVTVEVSHYSLRFRQRQEANWQRLLDAALETLPFFSRSHLALRRLMSQLAFPFEAVAARVYSRQNNIPWRPLDLGGLARKHLPRYARDLLTPENFQTLLTTADEPLEDFVAREYRRAHLSCRRPTWRLPGLDPEGRRRERLQVRRLRHYLGRYARVAHLGGWEHLAPWRDGDGLWAGLAELQPRRLFLDEADHEI